MTLGENVNTQKRWCPCDPNCCLRFWCVKYSGASLCLYILDGRGMVRKCFLSFLPLPSLIFFLDFENLFCNGWTVNGEFVTLPSFTTTLANSHIDRHCRNIHPPKTIINLSSVGVMARYEFLNYF